MNQQHHYVYHTSNSYELPKWKHIGTKATTPQNELYKIRRKTQTSNRIMCVYSLIPN